MSVTFLPTWRRTVGGVPPGRPRMQPSRAEMSKRWRGPCSFSCRRPGWVREPGRPSCPYCGRRASFALALALARGRDRAGYPVRDRGNVARRASGGHRIRRRGVEWPAASCGRHSDLPLAAGRHDSCRRRVVVNLRDGGGEPGRRRDRYSGEGHPRTVAGAARERDVADVFHHDRSAALDDRGGGGGGAPRLRDEPGAGNSARRACRGRTSRSPRQRGSNTGAARSRAGCGTASSATTFRTWERGVASSR